MILGFNSNFKFLKIIELPSLAVLILLSSWMNNAHSNEASSQSEVAISYCENHVTHQFAIEPLIAAYKSIDIKAKFVPLPCRRSLVEANKGVVYDGEAGRIADTDKTFTNLLSMDKPTITINGVVITKNITHHFTTWSDLKNFKIGIVAGELYAEKGTATYDVQIYNNYDYLLRMLAKGRIDVGVVILRDFELTLSKPEYFDSGIHVAAPPIYTAHLYHLLHKKHKDVFPKINRAIEEMWTQGTTQKIHDETFKRLKSTYH